MSCEFADIPRYLHYDGKKKKYSSRAFFFYHYLYRTGFKERLNPIEFPSITLTAISVCWSKIIKVDDVKKAVLIPAPQLGDHVYFGRVRKIKKVKLDKDCPEGGFKGKHTLSNVIIHSPLECNYSHAEILIKHSYYENNVPKEDIIKYEDWKKCTLYKGKPKEFFKEFQLLYRARMANLLNNNTMQLHVPFYLKWVPRHIIFSAVFLKNVIVNTTLNPKRK